MTSIRRTLPVPSGWPEPPDAAAYHGLAGEIVWAIAPHTEADPVAVLVQLLVAYGSLIGGGAWFEVEATRHYPNEFAVLVGDSAVSRKGSALGHVKRLLGEVQEDFPSRVKKGLSSGEGVVWLLRDRDDGEGAGAPDRRLLVTEPEFSRVLSGRELASLSPVLREAWDGEDLETLTRNSPLRATGAHLALIGHITVAELRHCSTSLSIANGFLNRFLFVACRRTQLLPHGGERNPLAKTGLRDRLAEVLEHARCAGELRFHSRAKKHWTTSYEEMSERSMDGVTGALTARAEAHCMRLALIYALLDGARSIQIEHLKAALALWDYAARSAEWALGDTTGVPLAEQLYRTLSDDPDELSRSQLRDSLHRNYPFVASVVLVMRSEAFAKAEVAALSTRRGHACLARQLGRVVSVEGEKKVTSFAAKVTFVPVAKALGPGAIALRVLAELPPAHEKDERQSKATFTHVDAAIFRVGPAEVFFLTFGVRPFPPASENRLLMLLHSRAEAHKLS